MRTLSCIECVFTMLLSQPWMHATLTATYRPCTPLPPHKGRKEGGEGGHQGRGEAAEGEGQGPCPRCERQSNIGTVCAARFGTVGVLCWGRLVFTQRRA